MEFHLFRNLNLLTINSIDDIFLIIANEHLLFSVAFYSFGWPYESSYSDSV